MSIAAIRTLRGRAWQIYEQMGMPTPQQEDWKYTDLGRINAALGDNWWKPAVPERSIPSLGADQLEALAIPDLDAWIAVFIDGRFQAALSDLPEGIDFAPLMRLVIDRPEQAASMLEVDKRMPLFNGFVAVNSALATDGGVLLLKANTVLDRPLLIRHIATRSGTAHIRHSIRLKERAEAHIVEHYCGIGEAAGLTNTVCQIDLAAGSRMRHDRIQMEQPCHYHIGRLSVTQARDSQFESHSVALGAALSRVDLSVELAGPGAACALNGLYLIDGRRHADHHTVIDHAVPHCTSREHYRGVLDDRARGVFNGKVVIREGAIKSDTAQSNANLLLSPFAEVDAKPELMIYNDDVKAAHGCTVGRLDTRQLFYLRARGLTEADARQVLTFAFADEVLASLKPAPLRRFVEHAAFSRLFHEEDAEEMLT
ncbi:MAG: Fe-S cluster assembly protein SufD [Gammaproteobacteria bacterium]|nr:Fe-S cluster assembly protein SufD [Gammaproteobacteria bacterium]